MGVPVVKLKLNEPVEAMLKYPTGKYQPASKRWPGSEPVLMFTVTGGDVPSLCKGENEAILNLPLDADQMFLNQRIGKGELFSICMRKTKAGAEYYELRKFSDAREPDVVPAGASSRSNYQGNDATAILEASIAHVKAQKSADQAFNDLPSEFAQRATSQGGPAAQPRPTLVKSASEQPKDTLVGHTTLSQLLSGCMVAAIDAAVVARDYAHTKGLTLSFDQNSIEKISVALLIRTEKQAGWEREAINTMNLMQSGRVS